jgi:hypothetical protein
MPFTLLGFQAGPVLTAARPPYAHAPPGSGGDAREQFTETEPASDSVNSLPCSQDPETTGP